jgi:hypothetical protein
MTRRPKVMITEVDHDSKTVTIKRAGLKATFPCDEYNIIRLREGMTVDMDGEEFLSVFCQSHIAKPLYAPLGVYSCIGYYHD